MKLASVPRRMGRWLPFQARRLKRATLDRRLSVRELWQRDVPAEVEFWRNYLDTHGVAWPDEYSMRINPDAPLQEPLIRTRLDRFRTPVVSILDVGAGPLTVLGKTHPDRTLEITAVDPLADHYDRMLADLNINPPVRTLKGSGENLVEMFGTDRFDIAYARNSIDHSVAPDKILRGMVAVVRPGGFVALRHYENEGASTGWAQLHQWNFSIDRGDLVVWGRNAYYNVTEELADKATVTARLDSDSDKGRWIVATIDKHE